MTDATDDDLSLLREVWGHEFDITFERGLYRARRYGTQSAVGCPNAAGLAGQLADPRLMRLYPPSERPADLREFLANCPLALPRVNSTPRFLRSPAR
jgi:hypothetical protein